MPKPKRKGPLPPHPRVIRTYGFAECLFCKNVFEKTRPDKEHCSSYCRVMRHSALNSNRKHEPGIIAEVDGRAVNRPVIDIQAEIKSGIQAGIKDGEFLLRIERLMNLKRIAESSGMKSHVELLNELIDKEIEQHKEADYDDNKKAKHKPIVPIVKPQPDTVKHGVDKH